MRRRGRSPEEALRIYGPPEYRKWADRQDCLVRGCETPEHEWRPDGRGFRELCHSRNGGTGRKADFRWTFVACWKHHDESGRKLTFQRTHSGRLWVLDTPVETLLEASVQTYAAFMRSPQGHQWVDRVGQPGPVAPGGVL